MFLLGVLCHAIMVFMKAIFDSLVRTFVPIVVGAVVAFFVSRGIVLDSELEGALTAGLGAAAAFVWYTAVRLLETYVTPKFGWLIGLDKAPKYNGKHVAIEE